MCVYIAYMMDTTSHHILYNKCNVFPRTLRYQINIFGDCFFSRKRYPSYIKLRTLSSKLYLQHCHISAGL